MRVCVCVCVAINSGYTNIWIVNDSTDSNSCLFFVAGFLLLHFGIVCVRRCVCVSVCVCLCVGVNSS